jgi:hypothetical protein
MGGRETSKSLKDIVRTSAKALDLIPDLSFHREKGKKYFDSAEGKTS